MSRYEYDDKDKAIVAERMAARAKLTGPRVGDFIRLPRLHPKLPEWDRITHNWGDHVQTGGISGSYYLCVGGGFSMSGGLDHGLASKDLIPSEDTREGSAWIFHHDYSGAGRGVYFDVPLRVWDISKGADLSGVYTLETGFRLSVSPPDNQSGDIYYVTKQGGYGHHKSFKTYGQMHVWLDEEGFDHPAKLPEDPRYSIPLTYKGTLNPVTS